MSWSISKRDSKLIRLIQYVELYGKHCKIKGRLNHFHTCYIGISIYYVGFPGGSNVKESAWNAGEPGSIPGLDLLCFVFFFLLSTGKIQQLWSSSTCYSVVTTSHGVEEKNRGVSVCLIWSSVAFFLGAGREVSGPLNSVWPVTNRFSRNKHGHPCSPDSKP